MTVTAHLALVGAIVGGLLLFATVAGYFRLRAILRSRNGDGIE